MSSGASNVSSAVSSSNTCKELCGRLVGSKLLADRRQSPVEMVLDRQHVPCEVRRRISPRVCDFLLHPPPDVLDFGSRIERVRPRFLELPFELSELVMLLDFRSAVGGLLAKLLGLVVQLLFVFRVYHAINLVSAFAVKSTMGTTRA